jgi:hypothetical protein
MRYRQKHLTVLGRYLQQIQMDCIRLRQASNLSTGPCRAKITLSY